MNEMQRTADVMARAAWLNAQIAAMQAVNQQAIARNEIPPRSEDDFLAVIREADLRPDLVRQFLVYGTVGL